MWLSWLSLGSDTLLNRFDSPVHQGICLPESAFSADSCSICTPPMYIHMHWHLCALAAIPLCKHTKIQHILGPPSKVHPQPILGPPLKTNCGCPSGKRITNCFIRISLPGNGGWGEEHRGRMLVGWVFCPLLDKSLKKQNNLLAGHLKGRRWRLNIEAMLNGLYRTFSEAFDPPAPMLEPPSWKSWVGAQPSSESHSSWMKSSIPTPQGTETATAWSVS